MRKGGWVSAGLPFFFSLSFLLLGGEGVGGWVNIHTSCGRSMICTLFLDTVHSTPPPMHGPSFSRSVAFSLDRHHAHAHMISYTFYFLSLSLSHPRTFFLSFLLVLSLRVTPLRYLFFFLLFFFSPPFSHLHSRAFMFVVFSYSATFKYRIFRNN